MKDKIIKYVLIFIIVLSVVIPSSILLSGFSGCARVYYKDSTISTKCNFALMLIKLKSIKGNESFEIGQYIRDCFNDLDLIRCKNLVYDKGKIDGDNARKLEFLQCLKDAK